MSVIKGEVEIISLVTSGLPSTPTSLSLVPPSRQISSLLCGASCESISYPPRCNRRLEILPPGAPLLRTWSKEKGKSYRRFQPTSRKRWENNKRKKSLPAWRHGLPSTYGYCIYKTIFDAGSCPVSKWSLVVADLTAPKFSVVLWLSVELNSSKWGNSRTEVQRTEVRRPTPRQTVPRQISLWSRKLLPVLTKVSPILFFTRYREVTGQKSRKVRKKSGEMAAK